MSTPRVAVVTGSNKGIGLAIVKELCRKFDGVVYLTSRDEARGRAAVEKLNGLGLSPRFHQLNIDDESSVVRLCEHLKSNYGGLDVLVNNAAVAFNGTSTEPFGQQARETLRTNFFGNLRVSQILLPILRPHARVVNVSGSVGFLGRVNGQEPAATALKKKLSSPDLTVEQLCNLMQGFVDAAQSDDHVKLGWQNSALSVSKVGISALTRIQHLELTADPREDIIINHVNPGYVDTDMTLHKGPMTVEEGAAAPSWLALLPPNVQEPNGAYVWHDKRIVDSVNGPLP